MYGEAPFRNPPSDLTQRLNWWKVLANDSGAQILAVGLHLVSCTIEFDSDYYYFRL